MLLQLWWLRLNLTARRMQKLHGRDCGRSNSWLQCLQRAFNSQRLKRVQVQWCDVENNLNRNCVYFVVELNLSCLAKI